MQEKQNYSMCNPQYPFVFLHLWNVLTFVLSRHGYSSYPAFFPCGCQGSRESGLNIIWGGQLGVSISRRDYQIVCKW